MTITLSVRTLESLFSSQHHHGGTGSAEVAIVIEHNWPADSHTDRAVDVLRDGLIWRLVLTADSKPNVTFFPLYQPAIPFHCARQVEEQQCREQERETQGWRERGQSAGHGLDV